MRTESHLYSRYFTYIKAFAKIPIIRTYGNTIFTLLAMIIFIVFAIKPTVETILVLQKKIADSNQILAKLNKKANDLSLARQNYDALVSQNIVSKISSAVPDRPELKSITSALETTSRKFDASISAIQIESQVLESSTEATLGTISEIGFTFNISGQYENLMSVLDDLRQNSRIISIDKLSLSLITEGTGLSMSITGKAYYLK